MAFKYIRTASGELSGKSFVEQTEQLIDDVVQSATETRTIAQSAVGAVDAAKLAAAEAVDAADAATQTAASSLTTAQSAESLASAAESTAEEAVEKAEEAKQIAEEAKNVAIGSTLATATTPGLVKPDGTTVTVASDGTLSVVGGTLNFLSLGGGTMTGAISWVNGATLRPSGTDNANISLFRVNGDSTKPYVTLTENSFQLGAGGTNRLWGGSTGLTWNDTPVLLGTRPASGNWTGTPVVGADGVTELGDKIDFHAAGSTADYDCRVTASVNGLNVTGTSKSRLYLGSAGDYLEIV